MPAIDVVMRLVCVSDVASCPSFCKMYFKVTEVASHPPPPLRPSLIIYPDHLFDFIFKKGNEAEIV